jgi:hypothetical protein
VVLQCAKLLELSLEERRKVLEQSGLCMYCLKHAAELECFGQGGFSKPKCMQSGCGREHAVDAHRLLGGSDASVNLATGDDYELEEEEEWWVNTVRAGREEEDLEEVRDSEPEENGGGEVRYFPSIYMRKDDSGLEDEFGYFWKAPIPSDSEEQKEDRCWSPEARESSSEEDEEEVRYLTNLLELEPKEKDIESGEPPPLSKDVPGPSKGSPSPPLVKPAEKGEGASRTFRDTELPLAKKPRRRKLRRRVTEDESHTWEVARQDAWLRELLTDSSGSETEGEYARFAESGRWIAEMTGIRDKQCRKRGGSLGVEILRQGATTS